jgi:hypothetical protein
MLRLALLALQVLEEVVLLFLQLLYTRPQQLDLVHIAALKSGLLLQLLWLRLAWGLEQNRLGVQIVALLLDLLQNLKFFVGFCGKCVGLSLQSLDESIVHHTERWALARGV